MKKIFLLMMAVCLSTYTYAQDEVRLPSPQTSDDYSMPVMEAHKNRRSYRSFSTAHFSDAQLSTLLWAACGINDPVTKRITAPSAINAQDIIVFVCRADGAWRYDPNEHKLVRTSRKDLRGLIAGRQEFAKEAPVCLVLASDTTKFRHAAHDYACMDAGYVSENIYLACTAMGLVTVARAQMDKETLHKELGLKNTEELILNHPVGQPK